MKEINSYIDYFNEVLLINWGPQINSRELSEKKLSLKCPKLYLKYITDIKERNLEKIKDFKSKIYILVYNLDKEDYLCPVCKTEVKQFQSFSKGFKKTCWSKNCSYSLRSKSTTEFYKTKEGKEIKELSKRMWRKTINNKLKEEISLWRKKIWEKNKENYNNKEKLIEIIKKRNLTIKKKYWSIVSYNRQRSNKMKKSCIKKYWKDSYSKTKECKERIKIKNQEKYGEKIICNLQILERPKTEKERLGDVKYTQREIKWIVTNLLLFWERSYPRRQEFRETMSNFLKERQRKKHYSNIIDILKNEDILHSISFEEYSSKLSRGKYNFTCNICKTKFRDYLNYNGLPRCPKCLPYSIPQAEVDLKNYLLSLWISETNILINTRQIIAPLELDLYISSHNLAIEYNWLMFHSFWKSKYSMFNNFKLESENKNYHLNKTELCEEQWINLLHINENEWLTSSK